MKSVFPLQPAARTTPSWRRWCHTSWRGGARNRHWAPTSCPCSKVSAVRWRSCGWRMLRRRQRGRRWGTECGEWSWAPPPPPADPSSNGGLGLFFVYLVFFCQSKISPNTQPKPSTLHRRAEWWSQLIHCCALWVNTDVSVYNSKTKGCLFTRYLQEI